ncbi:23349_t:CDS:2 [Gigaspora rosea]|nr:23349_t:CDS:2 [Gigaspora rosea]
MENIHTIDSLNAKLLTEITKLRKENDKIPELEKKFAEICDSGTGFLCCGWSWLSIDSSVSTVDLSNSIVDQQNNADTKSIEGVAKVSDKEIDDFVPEEPITKEKEMDSFLDSENKKMFSNLMRERNREKKLRTQKLMSPTFPEEESSILEESSIYNSHGIEKEKQNEISVEHSANVVSDDSNFWSLCDEKTKIPYNQKVEQGLRHELFVFTKDDDIEKYSSFDIQIPEFPLETILMGSNKIAMQSIAGLFNVAIKVGQKENLCWYRFYKAYEDRVEDCNVMKNIDDQSARTLVNNEIKFLLPNITDVNLRDSKVIGRPNNDYYDPMPSSIEKGTNEVQTDYDSDCSYDNDSRCRLLLRFKNR